MKRRTNMKFGHVEMEKPDNPIVWDALSKDEFDFVMRAKIFR